MIEGLRYSFPHAMDRVRPNYPALHTLRDKVAAHPRIAAYLASPRKAPFNDHGIFRHYAELDP
jgi:glutathione S-transferase